MKIISTILFIIIAGLSFGACVSSTTPALGGGSLITVTTQHVYGYGQGAQISSAKVDKTGESCSFSSGFLVDLFYYGSGGSIEEAKKRAGISKIAVVDRSSINIIGRIFYMDCIIVWGE